MSLTSRGARAAARGLRQPSRVGQQPRRNAATHGHGDASNVHGGHGHGESALHLPDANPKGNEGMGKAFYATIAFVPLFYLGYYLSVVNQDNFLFRQYEKYKEGGKDTDRRDLLHQTVLAQAIRDRARLASYPQDRSGPVLKSPEVIFNGGSPWNNVAGESSANLKELEQWYASQHRTMEEERLARIEKNGRVKTVYDD